MKKIIFATLLLTCAASSKAGLVVSDSNTCWDFGTYACTNQSTSYTGSEYAVNGYSDAFDGFGRLTGVVSGSTSFTTTSNTISGVNTFNDFTTIIGVNVNLAGQYATFTYDITYSGSSDYNTSIWWGGNLGSDGSTTMRGTSDGDLLLEATDTWAVTSDSGPFDPVIGVLWDSRVDMFNPGTAANNMDYGFNHTFTSLNNSLSLQYVLFQGDNTGGQAEIDQVINNLRNYQPSTISEPTSIALLGLVLAGFTCMRKKSNS
jgi:hypothetical protein